MYINVALRAYLSVWIPVQEMGKLVDWISFRRQILALCEHNPSQ